MEVIDYQEFINQDFLAVNSQGIFNIEDTATIPENLVREGLGNNRFNIDNFVSISEQQAEIIQLKTNQHKFIDTLTHSSHNFARHLQLGNEELNFDDDWADSSPKKDSLMSGYELSRNEFSQKNSQFVELDNLDSLDSVETLTAANSSTSENPSLLKNSGFDLALDGTNWLVGKTGKVKEYDQNVESVAYIKDVEGQGRQMYLKLPEEAKINYEDQLSLYQDISGLKTDKVYAVEARVKWLNPENKLPSAIVSFWAQNPDSSFRGQDFVITDGDSYKTLRFEYTPSQEGTVRFFLGLFTHINGNIDDTEIYVDDYKVTEIGTVSQGIDTRQGNVLSDGGFDKYTGNSSAKSPNGNWAYTIESPVPGLKQSVPIVNGNKKLRLELPKAQDSKDQYNSSVIGVYQMIDLVGGQTYKLSGDFQRKALDQFSSQKNSIVQFMMYRKLTNGQEAFLGPIDVELTNNNLQSKKFDVLAPESGTYTILVRLAGWGNEGNGVVVDVDNVGVTVK